MGDGRVGGVGMTAGWTRGRFPLGAGMTDSTGSAGSGSFAMDHSGREPLTHCRAISSRYRRRAASCAALGSVHGSTATSTLWIVPPNANGGSYASLTGE